MCIASTYGAARIDRSVMILMVSLLLLPAGVAAQAWTPPKGEGVLSLTFQSMNAGDHLLSSTVLGGVDFGSKSVDFGDVDGQVLLLDGDFGVTDRLAVSARLAYVSSRYTEGGRVDEGPASHRHLDIDDGGWHGSFQDAGIGARYMLSAGSWVVTPSAAVVFPVRDYVTLGHAAIGRGLNELQLGLDTGRPLFKSGPPRGYFQGGYRYAFVEKVKDISLSRSNLMLELGYFVNRFLTVRGFGTWQKTHGGIDWTHDIHDIDGFHAHDQAAAANWVRVGAGVSIPVGGGVNLFASVIKTIEGENTLDGTAVSVGTSWGFEAPGFGRSRIRIAER